MKHLIYFFFVLLIVGCHKKDEFKPDEPTVSLEAQTLKDIAYGGDGLQKMDIYLPSNRSTTKTKVIILIHGGAWFEGDKADSDFAPMVDSIRKRLPDWAIFNLNYRLATYKFPLSISNKFPAQEDDIKAAIKYIFDRSQSFVISNKWVLAGASAGAHLAMLQAYKNNQYITPKAVVDFFGPTDMTALYNFYTTTDPFTANMVNLLMGSNSQMYYNSSPINFVSAQSPPTIILQGGLDDVVPKEQSYTMRDKLQSVGVNNQLVYYDNQTHGWSDPAVLTDSFNKIIAFLQANVP